MSDIVLRNLIGDEFIVSAPSQQTLELNGNQSVQLTISPNKGNDIFINEIDTMWEVDYYGDTYKIVYAKKQSKGHSFYIDVRAVHKALDVLDTTRTYERFDGSLTSDKGFEKVFSDTRYSFVLLDTFNAIEIEGFGDGETRLESFKRLLDRFGAEFYISGTTFYIKKYIGRDTSFEYRYKLNASNVQEETDGTSTYTYVKGFGDYPDNDERSVIKKAKIKMEYESPLAKILGRRHAPMVAKGSYKKRSTVQKAMKEVIDNSVTISVSADVKDLRKQGYPYAQPELGDRVFINDSRIGLNQEVRVVNIVIERYSNGNVRNINLTFGNKRLGRRYASRLSSAVASLNALLDGTLELQFDVLDQRSKEMLRKIMSVDTELTLENGIYAVDKNNPNNVVGLNSAGWFISKDGGNTAEVIATSDGITANAITSGTIDSIRIRGTEIRGGKIYGTDIYGSTVTGGTLYTDADNDHYISLKGSELISRGIQRREWFGKKSNDRIRAMIYDGQFRVRNDDKDWSVYYSDMGISTQWDGSGDYIKEGTSGAIEFHSRRYSDGNYSGLTLYSDTRVALETNGGRIYLNPKGANVHVADARNNYYGISASAFSQSSERSLKRDIVSFKGNGSDIVRNLKIREYKRLSGGEKTVNDQWQIGLIVDEAPREVLANGSSIDIYSYTNVIAKALQEVIAKIDELENRGS